MKRAVTAIISIILLLTLCACQREELKQVKVETTPVDFDAQYIRTDVQTETDTVFPMFTVLQSVKELNMYYESNKETFNFKDKNYSLINSPLEFTEECKKYTSEFFENNALVVIVTEEPSGSNRHKVNSVSVTSEEKFIVDVSSIVPESGDDDMACWHILIEVSKEYVPSSPNDASIFLNGKLITDTTWHNHQPTDDEQAVSNPIGGYCGNTITTVYFEDDTSHTFMDSESVTMTDILVNLDYSSEICKCLPPYKVVTEFGTYGVNIADSYARCDKGQADLTQEQCEKLKKIIVWAKERAK